MRLAEDLATILLRAGDVIRLEGDLGAGKTSFARALLRAFADNTMLEVPSPTFTLVQTYEFPRLNDRAFRSLSGWAVPKSSMKSGSTMPVRSQVRR